MFLSMKKPILLFLLLVFILGEGNTQGYYTVRTAPAKARKAYDDGIREAQEGNFLIAIGFYERALKEADVFIDARLMMAGAFFELGDFARAETHFEAAVALSRQYQPGAWYVLAKAEWEQDKFEEAAVHADTYLLEAPTEARLREKARLLAESSRFAAEAIKNPVPFNPQSVGAGINTDADEYLPALTADANTLVFTRLERDDENFYISERQNGAWQPALPLNGVNTPDNEGAESISPDGTWLVFTACDRRNDGSQGSCDLYWSQLRSGSWTKPVPFSGTINSPHWDAQPCISADGRTIFFSSSRPGGSGDYDLWHTTRLSNGKWTTPRNLGPVVNTPGKEQTPYLHPDGKTLYFTSDGHPGMGHNDLYLTRRINDTLWSKPQNLGYPINTKAPEGAFTVSLDGKTAYFASVRPDGAGKNDIYVFDLPEKDRPEPATYVRAKVTDAATGKPLMAKADITDLKTGETMFSAGTKTNGTFLICLPVGRDYALNVNKEKYLFYSDHFNLMEMASIDRPFELEVRLQAIAADPAASAPNGLPQPASKPVVLRNVFFQTGSAALRPESASELNRLVALLQETPALRIQINGHTDNVGDDVTNASLSEQRAKTVFDYLLQKGIAPDRLRYKGFGETRPVSENDTENGRSLNRRTEFVTW
jgi:outer membrane protein OmpA-like peptidoglycan-associated protein